MRVIAGTKRSLKLVTPEGSDTRPTQDRIKETLFNMLQMDLPGCVFVDLFAGSGGIGIEALSRGASRAYFVDNSREADACIRKNLLTTGLEEQAVLLKQDVSFAITNSIREHADIIFMDPPYHQDYEKQALELLSHSDMMDQDTLIIVEADLETSFDYILNYGFDIVKQKKYKTNQHVFIQRR